MFAGPFKVIGKLPNGNLKLNIFKKNLYITHPDRVKLAETNFHFWENENRKMALSKKKRKKVNHQQLSLVVLSGQMWKKKNKICLNLIKASQDD